MFSLTLIIIVPFAERKGLRSRSSTKSRFRPTGTTCCAWKDSCRDWWSFSRSARHRCINVWHRTTCSKSTRSRQRRPSGRLSSGLSCEALPWHPTVTRASLTCRYYAVLVCQDRLFQVWFPMLSICLELAATNISAQQLSVGVDNCPVWASGL